MKKMRIALVALCAAVLLTVLAAAGCGGVDLTPLYGKTYTFTGKTLPVDWDGQTSAGYVPGEEKTSVGDLIEKYFGRVNWEYTVAADSFGILGGLTDSDKASPEAFEKFIDKEAQGIYSSLEGCTVKIGGESDEVDVTVTFKDASIGTKTYKCHDSSPDGDGTALSSEQMTGENWTGNASFFNSWNGVREYFSMILPDVWSMISMPAQVVLYEGENQLLVSIYLLAETTVA